MNRPARHFTHILLVEDSDDDAYFFFRALKKTNLLYQVDHVKDGGEAIRYLSAVFSAQKPIPDRIFVDLKLPVKSGFEILGWIRAQTEAPPLDIAILSGSDDEKDRIRAITYGVAGYFVKPISVEDLIQRLSQNQGKATADTS
ncbi:MAG TPA: response regulator [Opitutaceae bacterium]|nr:response regulator [Opitutaceae bacterium]